MSEKRKTRSASIKEKNEANNAKRAKTISESSTIQDSTDSSSQKLEVNAMKVNELKEQLKKYGLKSTGTRKELVERLQSSLNSSTKKNDNEEEEEEEKEKEKEKEVSNKKKGKGKNTKKEETQSEKDKKEIVASSSSSSSSSSTQPADPNAPITPITADDSQFIKLISWNVNGLAALLRSGDNLKNYVQLENPDVICLQETKSQNKNIPRNLLTNYPYEYWSCSTAKLGYSGTAIFSKIEPLSVSYGIDVDKHDKEGRTITLEFANFYLVNSYIPNAGQKLERLSYRQDWNKDFLAYLSRLDAKKPVVWTGDLNVAHQEIDIHSPKTNKRSAGFTIEERTDFGKLLEAGFVDTFRHQNPNVQQFTYWSYRFDARNKNRGWRLDYFVVSERFVESTAKSFVRPSVLGSDHCPIGLLVHKN